MSKEKVINIPGTDPSESILVDKTTGEPIATHQSADGDYHLGTAMVQNVYGDDNNSSTTNLVAANSYTFTGTSTSTLGVVGLQWSLNTDQNATVCIDQSPDGTNWDITDCFDYIEAHGGDGNTVQALNSYWRIRVILTGTTDTTHFRVQGVLCPIAEPLPRSLSDDGRLKSESTLTGKENTERHVWVTPTNELSTTETIRLVGTTFDGATKDTSFWTETVTGSGTVSQSGEIELSTGTTLNSTAAYESVRSARFVGGSALKFKGLFKFVTAGTANNVRRGGAYSATDGFFFQLNGSTFSVGVRRASSDTLVNSGNFNGNLGATLTINPAVYYKLEIEWTPAGAFFYVNGALLHEVLGGHLTNFLTQPIMFENVNSGGLATDIIFDCIASIISRLGPLLTSPISKYQSGTTAEVICKVGAGVIRGIILSDITLNSVIIIYDGDVATGTVIWNSGSMGNKTEPYHIDFYNLPFSTGLSFAITTQDANMIIIYE